MSLLVGGQSMHQFKDSFLSPTLSARICGNPVGCKISSASPSFWMFTTVLLDHTGETFLVLFSEDSLTVLVCTVFFLTGSDVT